MFEGIDSESTESSPELQAILENIKNGSGDAANELHQRFVDRLVRLASTRINRRFRSKIEPEEIVQSVFASFFRRHEQGEFTFDGWNDLWALLVRITICKCTNRVTGFMTAKRNIRREIQGRVDSANDSSLYAVSIEPTAEETVVFNETLDQLLDLLPNDLQEIVCLRLQGHSNLEISEKIDRSERTVYRSLERVRVILEEIGTA